MLNLEENLSISDCKKMLATTERNVKRLIAVVDDLMRLCDEQESFDIEPIFLQDMFTSICNKLSPLIEEKDIDTEVTCNMETILGNLSLTYRAFYNLVENAIKYNKIGGRINIQAESKNGINRISISDIGDGISVDEIGYIFEPFYRIIKSRSRKTGGAGLGLSIVKMITEKHNWEITVDSELGVGSIFTINLNDKMEETL